MTNALTNNILWMVNEYFGFHENPFNEKHDINFFFLNETNKKLYQDLVADIYQGVNAAILTGNKGVGKTAFLQQLIGLDPFQLKVMYIHAKPGMNLTDDLYRKIIPVANSPDTNRKAPLIEHLTNLRQQGINPVLIVDNAQALDDSSLTPILELSEQSFEQRPILQLILATDPTLPARFDTPPLLQFKLLISRQYRLDSLVLGEIRDFINFRLEQAGCIRKNLFSNSAIQTIAARTQGIPKLIIQLCNEALQQACLAGEKIINDQTVSLASENLYQKNSDYINSTQFKKNANRGISKALLKHQNCQKKTKNNPSRRPVQRRTGKFMFAAIALLSTAVVFLLNSKPEQTKADQSEIKFDTLVKTNKQYEQAYTSPNPVEQPKKHQAAQAASLNGQNETETQQIASIQTPLESLGTEQSASTSLPTDDNKPVQIAALISEPTNPSKPPFIEQPSLEPPKSQFNNTTEHPQKTNYKKPAISNQYTKITTNKTLENITTELDPREQQAKQRAEARLKLHQSGTHFGIESLMAAAASGDQKTMELLLTGGIPADIQEQTRGFTALEIAAGHGHNDIIKLLIVKSGAWVNLKNFKGRTALMIASESGHADTVDFLLSNGAKVNLKDKNGWTALMFAAYNNHLQTAHILMDWGANPQLKNNAGRTAMQIARSRGNTGLIKMVTQKTPGKTSTSNQFNISSRDNLYSPHIKI